MVSGRQVTSSTSWSTLLSPTLRPHFWIINRVCPWTFGFGFKPCMLVCKWNGGEFFFFFFFFFSTESFALHQITFWFCILMLKLTYLGRYCTQSICCLSRWPDAFQKCWSDSCEQVRYFFILFYGHVQSLNISKIINSVHSAPSWYR